jgi:hypothetical protein
MFHWNFRDAGRGLAPLLRSIVVKLKVVESVILDAEERLISEEVKLILPPNPKWNSIF